MSLASGGVWMLLALGGLIVFTGLPVWALLLGTASAAATCGLALGAIDAGVLAALPSRMVGLLEHDLLQALPLYVLVGVLLQYTVVADALFESLAWALRHSRAAKPLAALGVGALVAPMNGSVASSASLLARLLAPRLKTMEPARATALVSVAATIGVVVPPSMVLILLGDAMLHAHIEATNLPGFVLGSQRVINTQDVLSAALVPALLVLALWALVLVWQQRGRNSAESISPGKLEPNASIAPVSSRYIAISSVAVGVLVVLLGGVFTGRLFAVEAAATATVLLVASTWFSRALTRAQWRIVLADTLALSGALFALLVGASTFSLVFRLWGTDRWMADAVTASVLSPQGTAALVLLGVALCAWVMDAFEMIFVIIPIVAPLLILKLGDAQQAAVLLLLVLQLSFLIPPMGYAVLMARSRGGFGTVGTTALVKAILPFALVQLSVVAIVFAFPAWVHALDGPALSRASDTPSNAKDIETLMEQMAAPATESTSESTPEPASEPAVPQANTASRAAR